WITYDCLLCNQCRKIDYNEIKGTTSSKICPGYCERLNLKLYGIVAAVRQCIYMKLAKQIVSESVWRQRQNVVIDLLII
nr:hypothetical protein [Tanacetum cinerariifolium]